MCAIYKKVYENNSFDTKEFIEATRPALEWFNRNCNPQQKIIIQKDHVELVSDEIRYIPEAPN